jgi:hypothetical protein
VLVAAALAGCSSSGKGGEGAKDACDELRDLSAQAASGTVAYSEIRPQVKDIDDLAYASSDQTLKTQGDAMLRSITNQVDANAFGAAVTAFKQECVTDGHGKP